MVEMDYLPRYGTYATCLVCGKEFFISYPEMWVFKKDAKLNRDVRRRVYFCKYSCKRKFDKEYEKYIFQLKQESGLERQKRERARRAETLKNKEARYAEIDRKREGKFCKDCYYLNRDQYGFYNCSFNYVTKAYKAACRRYKPKNEERMEYG